MESVDQDSKSSQTSGQEKDTNDVAAPATSEATPEAPTIRAVPPPPPDPPIVIAVRGLHDPVSRAHTIPAASGADAIKSALAYDVSNLAEPIIIWKNARELVALDFDRPDGAPPLTDTDIPMLFPSHAPRPYHAWITHGAGLRVIFCAVESMCALDIAGAWYLLTDLGPLRDWRLEVKTDTRHPMGLRDGQACGAVFTFVPTNTCIVRGATSDSFSDEERARWLAERQLSVGRHPSQKCPWNPKPTSGNDPVSITDLGVRCYHCGRSATWSELLAGDGNDVRSRMITAARSYVHLPHQQYVIEHAFPNIPRKLVEPAWRGLLYIANGDRLASANEEVRPRIVARIDRAAHPKGVQIVRSASGGWLDSETLQPRVVKPQLTLKHLPSCLNDPMVDRATVAGPLEGYVPVHPQSATQVVGPFVDPPTDAIFVRARSRPGDPPPVDVSKPPPTVEVERAWEVVDAALPGITRGYHAALVLAIFVAQRGIGTPPMLAVTGQSGSAKTAQVHLAAGCVGTRATPITLGSTDDTTRKAGLALEGGSACLFVDEVGRVEGVFSKLEPILSANSTLYFRAKYANERCAPMRAVIVMLGSTLPEAIVRSPELARRAPGYRLLGAEKDWKLTRTGGGAPVDLADARRLDYLRPALDTITAHLWWRLHRLGPAGDWRALVINEYGAIPLGQLDLTDPSGEVRKTAIRGMYEIYRTAQTFELSQESGHQGWLVSTTPRVADQLGALIDIDAEKARFTAQTADLERMHLAPILGVRTPQLQLLIRRRSSKVLVKFIEVGVMKGKGLDRSQLPPLDSDPPTTSSKVTV